MDPVVFDIPEGRFVADGEATLPDSIPHVNGYEHEEQVLAFSSHLWNMALRGRAPVTARMKRNEFWYMGYHYRSPQANQENEVTNLCYTAVETAVPILTKARPRPRIMSRRAGMGAAQAERLQSVASWFQDELRTDRTFRKNTRVKCKYGHAIHLITCDNETGMPYLIDWSPFDFYWDPGARNMQSAEFFVLAAPIATRRLKSMFPERAAKIIPDNFTSPSYDAIVRAASDYQSGINDVRHDGAGASAYGVSGSSYEGFDYGSTTSNGSSHYVSSPDGAKHEGTDTTFLIQIFLRDYSKQWAYYRGTVWKTDEFGNPASLPNQVVKVPVAACPSGWRVIQVTPNGVLDEAPLDTAYMGLPFVIEYDIEHEGRIDGIGEIDPVWSINAGVNERKALLNNSLRFAGAPVLVASKGSGITFNDSGVQAGDVLEPRAGSEISWLKPPTLEPEQFAMLDGERRDFQMVGGVSDALMGQRPTGIEAGTAIRDLYSAGSSRVEGKNPGALEARSLCLRKLMHFAAHKLKEPFVVQGSGGDPLVIAPEELRDQYDVTWVEGSGMEAAKRERKDEALQLFSMQLLPPGEVLKAFDWPDYERIGMEMQQFALQKAAVEAQARAQSLSGGKPPGG